MQEQIKRALQRSMVLTSFLLDSSFATLNKHYQDHGLLGHLGACLPYSPVGGIFRLPSLGITVEEEGNRITKGTPMK